MKLPPMAENSLFAILLRSPWWISLAIAAVLALAGFAALPPAWRIFGIAAALPFIIIAGITLWRSLKRPSSRRVEKTLESVRTMSWQQFADSLEAGLKRDGYTVTRSSANGFDFELARDGRRFLLGAKRFKAAKNGVEPLRDLVEAADRHDGGGTMFVTVGELTDQARAFAIKHRVALLRGEELARLMPELGKARKAA